MQRLIGEGSWKDAVGLIVDVKAAQSFAPSTDAASIAAVSSATTMLMGALSSKLTDALKADETHQVQEYAN